MIVYQRHYDCSTHSVLVSQCRYVDILCDKTGVIRT